MRVTYYGHSCFAVEVRGKTFLFDPFITPNPLAGQIDLACVRADYLLLSHGHEDHVADAVPIARRTRAKVLCNYEIYLWLTRQGVENVQPMNHGGTARLEAGAAKMVNAVHSSSLPDGVYGGNPCGWLVETAEGSFYYAGDTALTADMKILGETTRLRFAALPIGDTFTMGVDDAVKAADWVGCSTVLGLHYDTFPPLEIDHQIAIEKFLRAGKKLHLVPIGDTIGL
jgi:L-ascorbate metabolism protein UlaG (beta-lactamase superfamily)